MLGYPEYYRRFGFRPASRFDIDSEHEDAGDAFMALELETGILAGRAGTVRYDPAFSAMASLYAATNRDQSPTPEQGWQE